MNNSRGSIWRKCDFHVHTPYSVLHHEFGDNFDTYVQTLFKRAIEKRIQVIGITDYFTIEGYKKIKREYLGNDAKLKELFSEEEILKIKGILVLPNIEFRINKIIQINKIIEGGVKTTESGRINFHIILSDKLPIEQIEENFLHEIDFIYEADPDESDKRKKLKVNNLAALGKRLKVEQPELEGSDLKVGMTQAIVDDEKVANILVQNNDFRDKYLIVIPSDEDLSEINWKGQDSLTRKVIIQRAHILFASNPKTISFGLGEKASTIEEFTNEFKTIKPCIWGSDSHKYETLFEPSNDNYCWIKADPTFDGIRQLLFEPKDRVFIGKAPAIIGRIKSNPRNYIDSIKIDSIPSYTNKQGIWFKHFDLKIGYELTAIIGNKGKGKSAIADILGLLGNAHIDRNDFSFLKNSKFCQKGYAENFAGELTWGDGSKTTKILNEDIDPTGVERVKYIPQAYLEKLCNNKESEFTEEINKVVFLRLDESDKLGTNSFSELKNAKTEIINSKINDLKISLNDANEDLVCLEDKSVEQYLKIIENKLKEKQTELQNHLEFKTKIKEVLDPEKDVGFSEDQKLKASSVSKLNERIEQLQVLVAAAVQKLKDEKIEYHELDKMLADIKSTNEKFTAWKTERIETFKKYGLDINNVLSLVVKTDDLTALLKMKGESIAKIIDSISPMSDLDDKGVEKSNAFILSELIEQRDKISKELEKPFKDFEAYKRQLKEWESKKIEIIGDDTNDESIKYLEKEIDFVKNRLQTEIAEQIKKRNLITLSIYNQKRYVQDIFSKMKEAVSGILKEYSAEQNITIETSFKIDPSFSYRFFEYVNRYGDFHQKGDEELKTIISLYDFDHSDDVEKFINNVFSKDLRFKEGRQLDFYNYICSLDYLSPEYHLRLNNKPLHLLSPGEKGGLLLVFYLVLDKDNKPLIIDQPEDNLDNQSVAEILVPYIKNAKKKRQIIMVTHNPNLAIVADAEHIIYMNIDKENDYKVSFDSGGIENLVINNHIVNILEGKMKAFDNRRMKYRSK